MVKDHVCGMEIDPKSAAAKSEHQGQTYYFCSGGCKKTFEREPHKYAGSDHVSSHQHSNARLETPQAGGPQPAYQEGPHP